jgi:CubicO group peptidase (beta-lactamase class C family)
VNQVKRYLAFFLFLLFSSFASSEETDDFVQQQMKKQHIPGLALVVIHNGQIVKSRGYGMANLEHQIPVKPETIGDLPIKLKRIS